MMEQVPAIRISATRDQSPNGDGEYVLYWMMGARRTRWNFGLQRAVEWSVELGKPLVVLEALRVGYPWASDRFHHFVIQGMADQARAFDGTPVTYFPYLEPTAGDGKGLLAELAKRAAVVVADEFPCFFLPRMVAAASEQISVRFEQVDSCGLLPLRATDKVFARAFDLRRYLQKNLLPHLAEMPVEDPLDGAGLPAAYKLPKEITRRWPAADVGAMAKDDGRLVEFEIDHSVGAVETVGGESAARMALEDFAENKVASYADARNEPAEEMTSGLSPYLHFGHLSAHEVFARFVALEEWTPERVADKANGSSRGWWGMSEGSESFLDELITWRELGFNRCHLTDDYAEYDSLPDWAKDTLADHLGDEREYVYSLEEFDEARTHDAIWNAAQRQLVREGRIHNYLRMLWGKKIVEWTADPRDALEIMIELNNRYALDGRDPNSYSGIFWVLGRYDRAWGPERPIFGKVRWMSSENTARKVKVKPYLERYAADARGDQGE